NPHGKQEGLTRVEDEVKGLQASTTSQQTRSQAKTGSAGRGHSQTKASKIQSGGQPGLPLAYSDLQYKPPTPLKVRAKTETPSNKEMEELKTQNAELLRQVRQLTEGVKTSQPKQELVLEESPKEEKKRQKSKSSSTSNSSESDDPQRLLLETLIKLQQSNQPKHKKQIIKFLAVGKYTEAQYKSKPFDQWF